MGLVMFVCVCVCVCVCECVCVRDQSVGSQADEVVRMCNQLTGETFCLKEIDCVGAVRLLTRFFYLRVCLASNPNPDSNP